MLCFYHPICASSQKQFNALQVILHDVSNTASRRLFPAGMTAVPTRDSGVRTGLGNISWVEGSRCNAGGARRHLNQLNVTRLESLQKMATRLSRHVSAVRSSRSRMAPPVPRSFLMPCAARFYPSHAAPQTAYSWKYRLQKTERAGTSIKSLS